MSLPADFDAKLWFDPLTFQGLVGAGLARGCYASLFRDTDGFAKPISELRKIPEISNLVKELDHSPIPTETT